MTEEVKAIFKFITLFVVGFLVNYGMTRLAAPGYDGTAMAVGLLLTTFGSVLAASAMQLVMVPIGIIKIARQLARGEKPIKRGKQKNDKLDQLGRILFIFLYAMFSAITGIYVGALSGGMGLLTTTGMFAFAGVLLSLFSPMDFIWATQEADSAFGLDATQKARMDEARKNGDPSVLFVGKVSKRVIDALVEAPTTDDKSDNR
ncbi:MAG: hypothetical protein ACREO1_07025 [Arenimonas sp.]